MSGVQPYLLEQPCFHYKLYYVLQNQVKLLWYNYKNNSELLLLYDNLISNEKISLEIKERVKKIHEFYIFK